MQRDPNAEKYENVVIDTTVLLASVGTPGGAANAAVKKAQEEYTVVQTPDTLQELKDKAQDPDLDGFVSREAREQLAEDMAITSDLVENTHKVDVCRDPNDNMMIEAALSSGAKQVITYDKDLRDMKEYEGISFRTPAEFLKRERELDERREVFRGGDPSPQADNSIQGPQGPLGPTPGELDGQKPPTLNSVEQLASLYAEANPDSGASAEEHQEAAYFAHAVEDSDKYPPRDDEMQARIDDRRFEEQFEKNYSESSGETREEDKQELMQERMQAYMDRQKQYTM